MPVRICREPRCPEPATWRGRCATHNRTNERNTQRAGRSVYNTRHWKLLRKRVLFEQPICAACDNALATDVDHISAIEDGGAPYDRSNLQGLCSPCHSRKTRQEQLARS